MLADLHTEKRFNIHLANDSQILRLLRVPDAIELDNTVKDLPHNLNTSLISGM